MTAAAGPPRAPHRRRCRNRRQTLSTSARAHSRRSRAAAWRCWRTRPRTWPGGRAHARRLRDPRAPSRPRSPTALGNERRYLARRAGMSVDAADGRTAGRAAVRGAAVQAGTATSCRPHRRRAISTRKAPRRARRRHSFLPRRYARSRTTCSIPCSTGCAANSSGGAEHVTREGNDHQAPHERAHHGDVQSRGVLTSTSATTLPRSASRGCARRRSSTFAAMRARSRWSCSSTPTSRATTCAAARSRSPRCSIRNRARRRRPSCCSTGAASVCSACSRHVEPALHDVRRGRYAGAGDPQRRASRSTNASMSRSGAASSSARPTVHNIAKGDTVSKVAEVVTRRSDGLARDRRRERHRQSARDRGGHSARRTAEATQKAGVTRGYPVLRTGIRRARSRD